LGKSKKQNNFSKNNEILSNIINHIPDLIILEMQCMEFGSKPVFNGEPVGNTG
jgi:hypothetical protein